MTIPSTTEPPTALRDLLARWRTIEDLNGAGALLSWDRQTMMPPGGAEARGHQLATLAGLVHAHLTDPELRAQLDRSESAGFPRGSDENAAVREIRHEVDHASRVPAELVEELTRTKNRAQQVLVRARRTNDFAAFAPELEKVLELRRREADALGWADHPYDALHDRFERGSTKARVDAVFGPLRDRLTDLSRRIRATGRDPGNDGLLGDFPPDAQEAFARDVVGDFGYDFECGRLDPTVHPFAQAIGHGDVRITTRYAPDALAMALFGTMHEAGHALYEQGIPEADRRTPLGHAASLAVHESQSRLWENLVGRSHAFWEGRFPALKRAFPGAFDDVPLDAFVAQINRVHPSLIRVEADEVTYGLHVILRYELEVALLEGTLAVRDLPEAWNAKMQDLLGITPPDDARGCLQDVHWSIGAVGYFPTYALGTIMSVQLWRAAERVLPSLHDDVRSGRFAPLLGWLRENVHAQGTRLAPDDLLLRATGAPLSAEPFLDYLEIKYGALYGLPGER